MGRIDNNRNGIGGNEFRHAINTAEATCAMFTGRQYRRLRHTGKRCDHGMTAACQHRRKFACITRAAEDQNALSGHAR